MGGPRWAHSGQDGVSDTVQRGLDSSTHSFSMNSTQREQMWNMCSFNVLCPLWCNGPRFLKCLQEHVATCCRKLFQWLRCAIPAQEWRFHYFVRKASAVYSHANEQRRSWQQSLSSREAGGRTVTAGAVHIHCHGRRELVCADVMPRLRICRSRNECRSTLRYMNVQQYNVDAKGKPNCSRCILETFVPCHQNWSSRRFNAGARFWGISFARQRRWVCEIRDGLQHAVQITNMCC